MSKEESDSLKFVAKRVNSFVDYKNAKDNLDSVKAFGERMKREESLFLSNRKAIDMAKQDFKNDPKKVLRYGFIPTKFTEQLQVKEEAYKELTVKYEKAESVFRSIYEHSKRAYELQKHFTNEEFKILYPKYAERLPDTNDKAMELKHHYVELFKKEQQIKSIIPELETSLHKYQNNYVSLEKDLNDWNELNKSLVILERTKVKHQREYKDVFEKNWESNKVYEKAVKYLNVNNQIQEKERQKEKFLNQIFTRHLKEKYPDIPKEAFNQMPQEFKSKMLELHLQEKHTGKFSKDLDMAREEILQENISREKSPQVMSNYETNLSSGVNDIFNAIMKVAEPQQQYDDLERKRQRDKVKAKPSKLRYKEMEENEL